MTSIGNYAFSYCSGLTSITIPNSVRSIGNQVFANCSSLNSVNYLCSLQNEGTDVFYNCNNIKEIVLDCEVVTSLFCNITSLETVILRSNVKSIGENAFLGCSGIKSFMIPNNVTSIGNNAFTGCTGLSSIIIPNSIISIGSSAFSYIDLVTVVSEIVQPFKISGKSSVDRTFSKNTFNNATLYVPVGTIEDYKATEGWKDFVFIEEGDPSGIEQPLSKTRQIQSEDGVLTIQNVKNGTSVSVYNANGTFVGSTISQNEQAIIDTNMQPGSVAIVKIGEQSVKVIIK